MGSMSHLSLQFSPMEFTAGPERAKAGAQRVFKRARRLGVAVVGGTESHMRTRLFRAIPRAAKAKGYRVAVHRFGLWLALDEAYGKPTARGFLPVLEAKRVSPRLGGHQPRGIFWVEFEHSELGTIVVGVGHWLTRRPDTAERRAQNRAYTDAFIDFLDESGRGQAIAFLMGDTNDDDEPQDDSGTQGQLESRKLSTCWDDVDRHPATTDHGGETIDVIARRAADARVSPCFRALALPNPSKDHHDIVASYDVKDLRKP